MNNDIKKTPISKENVQYVSNLSRLRIDDSRIDQFQAQISGILEYIDQLNELDTENVVPMSHVLTSMKNVFREDVLKPSLSPDEALQSAPERENNFFKVARIIQDS
jgi:aspartyl-tRNA(Asn)/glutamyl-tRNA(Gln) amidotransferase subunit C